MTPELKTKWLSALRSGNYQQGRDVLNRDGKMCCLGVLCDVAGYTWDQIDEDESYGFKCKAGEAFIENDEEREKLGLSKEIHSLCYSMNDGTFTNAEVEYLRARNIEIRPQSFEEIADWLEKNL